MRIRSPRIAPPLNGLDGNDRDVRRALSVETGQPIDERRLAAARWTGDSDSLRVAGLWVELSHRLGRARLVVLNHRDEPRDRSLVARPRASEKIPGGRRRH